MPTIYATETHELLGLPEGWLTRSGTGIIFGIVMLSLLAAHFIRYPELAVVPVTVYGNEAKIDLLPKQNGRLWHIAVSHGDSVAENALLFVLESTTDWEEALFLDDWLKSPSAEIPELQNLGALQADFGAFALSWKNQQRFENDSVYLKSLAALQKETQLQDALLRLTRQKYQLLEQTYALLNRKVESDSVLFRDGVISLEDWEQSQRNALAQRQNLLQNQELQLTLRLRKQQLESQQANFLQERNENLQSLADELQQRKTALEQNLHKWCINHLIRSPKAGQINFFDIPKRFSQVTPQESLATLIATDQESYAYAEVPEVQITELKRGNSARIKLRAYPSIEFGWLPARVSAVSINPTEEGNYAVRLHLSQGFLTSESEELDVRPESQGVVEIVLKERSLLENLLGKNPITHAE